MPNASFKVEKDQLAEFADTLTSIKTAQDYSKLKDDFSIRRTDPEFWSLADELHTWYIPVIIQDACFRVLEQF